MLAEDEANRSCLGYNTAIRIIRFCEIVMALIPSTRNRPANLAELLEEGWTSKSVKQEIHDNF